MNRPSPSQSPPFGGPGFGAEPTQRRSEPSHDALPPGTRLAEYELLSVLAEGRFGIVYLAMDHGLQRHVAIKEYLPAALASRGRGAEVILRSDRHAETFALGLGAFVEEARLLARFDQPALVRVYRFWEANGTAYMVMPYYEGVTLGVARRAMTRPPDEAWLRDLLLPLLGALEVLHGASCYPRDISPDNILVRPDGRPVLLDCGAARHGIGDRTQALTAILEPAFAPIEQYAESTKLREGPWTNLYALAAVAYYCISGHPPVASTVRALDDQMEPLFQVVDGLGRSFPELEYSVAFVSAIERALSVRPEERPQSVAEFRRALLGGRGVAESVAVPPAVDEAVRTPSAPPPGQAPGGAVDDDEAALRAALDTALQPDSVDLGPPPQPGGEEKAGGWRAALMMGVAGVALVVLAVGGWMLWSYQRDANTVPPSQAGSVEREGGAAPLLQAEPPATVLAEPSAETAAPAPAGVPAEPQPPPATAAPAAQADAAAGSPDPGPAPSPPEQPAPGEAPPPPSEAAPAEPPAEEEAAVAEAPPAGAPPASPAMAETAPSPPPESPAVAETAPSPPPPAKVVDKEPDNPRELCGPRTQFSLYRCMKRECERPKYYGHPECRFLRSMDAVRPLP